MPNDTTQPDNTEPGAAESDTPGTKDPTGVEGANPALDDTGSPKAEEVGEAPEQPEDPQNLDLTPEGLSDEPAQQEDPDSVAKPENS
ncbi:hypothetical protein [Arthrobacter sp. Soil762]|uniref:hypothetical protein n=1 Tax=Arthrobacter sp. Soil762 TaxID=1736401 RepID=UPI0006F25190|nr:hypothetical protein [Arthrobacter sp. Soil762]KRE72254.1 hypothetical protein ASG77_10275 [Arthrobacter sp. Soil762]